VSLDPAIFRALVANGATPKQLLAVVEAAAAVEEERRAKKRAGNAERQQRFRDRRRPVDADPVDSVSNEHNALQAVTARDGVTAPAPSPSPLPSPDTPNQPHTHTPTRDGFIPRDRLRVALAGLAVILSGSGSPKPKAVAPKARWPKDMPPPVNVSDDQWAGFVQHRIAKRERLTPRAYQLLSAKLGEFAENGWPPGEAIDRAVERGWVTVFPPDGDNRSGKRPHHHQRNGHGARGLLGAVLDAERDRGAGASV